MSEKTLRDRLAEGEGAAVSFFADAEDETRIAQDICAMLNASTGGVIYLGVDKHGKPAAFDFNPERMRKLEGALKARIAPPSLYSISLDTTDGVAIGVVDVPPGSDRPYVLDGAIWVRDRSRSRPAAISEIRTMFETPEVERWERRLSRDMTEDDIDLEIVRSVKNRGWESGRLDVTNISDDLDLLRELGFQRTGGFTNAADIVFSEAPARRHPQVRVQLIALGKSKTDDRFADNRWFDTAVIETAFALYQALEAYNSAESRFERGAIERQDRLAYDPFSLREGIVNALAHRDYESFSGGVKVTIYPDRIEIWNSGSLPPGIKIKDLPRKHQSYPVNPDIAHAFYLRGLMEKTGRGGELIAENSRRLGARAPTWSSDDSGVTLTIFSAVAATAMQGELNARQTALLKGTEPGEAFTLKAYHSSYAPDVDPRQARRDLSELVDRRLLEVTGAARATVYRRPLA